MNIKIYGTGTSGQQMVSEKLSDSLLNAGLAFRIENIENVNSFIHDMVHSVPAIRVDDQDLYEINMNGRFNSTLRSAIQQILRKSDYGAMTKFIVPTDFSEISFNAYNYASNLAKLMNGVLYITHIYFPNSTNVNEIVYLDESAEQIYQQKLSDFVESINQDWIGEFVKEPFVESKFITGFPYKEILKLSEEKNSMIVMGSTGGGDSFKKIFGSLSLDVMKSAKCPVFVIPKDVQYADIRNVLFCSEDVSFDANALVEAGRLCENLGAHLHIGHIVTKTGEDYKIDALEALLKKYFPNLIFSIHMVENSSPTGGIDLMVNKLKTDLLVFNTRHRNFFTRWLHESVTEHVALYTQKPILVYHKE